MNWRLNEGRGECMYMLGYADDGRAKGISASELSASVKTLRVMTAAVGAKIAHMQVSSSSVYSWNNAEVLHLWRSTPETTQIRALPFDFPTYHVISIIHT